MTTAQQGMDTTAWVVLLSFLCLLILALLLGIRYGRRHEQAMRDLAQRQGWRFERGDQEGYEAKLGDLFPERRMRVVYAMTVEPGFRKIVLLEVSDRPRHGTLGPKRVAVCLVESARLRNVGALVEITETGPLAELLPDQVEMGESEFARQFVVQSEEPELARRVVNESLQAVMLEHARRPLYNPVWVAIKDGRLALLTWSVDDPDRWRDLVHLGRAIEAAIR